MINEQKILDYLQNEEKIPLVSVDGNHWIVVKSQLQQVKKLIAFCEPLHYSVQYFPNSGLCIIPNK